jgi:hypothetical protein
MVFEDAPVVDDPHLLRGHARFRLQLRLELFHGFFQFHRDRELGAGRALDDEAHHGTGYDRERFDDATAFWGGDRRARTMS